MFQLVAKWRSSNEPCLKGQHLGLSQWQKRYFRSVLLKASGLGVSDGGAGPWKKHPICFLTGTGLSKHHAKHKHKGWRHFESEMRDPQLCLATMENTGILCLSFMFLSCASTQSCTPSFPIKSRNAIPNIRQALSLNQVSNPVIAGPQDLPQAKIKKPPSGTIGPWREA